MRAALLALLAATIAAGCGGGTGTVTNAGDQSCSGGFPGIAVHFNAPPQTQAVEVGIYYNGAVIQAPDPSEELH